MTRTLMLDVPLNRVEGDLEIRVEVRDGVVVDAWSSGTMFRGFENMMVGRAPLDDIAGVAVPANAVRQRNVALMAEHVQSDLRQAILMFMVDFAGPGHAGGPLHEEAARRYAPIHGESCIETIRATRTILELVALIGGQWPHSSFMVPGGVVRAIDVGDLIVCRQGLQRFRQWYEGRILGCSLERWGEVRSAADLDAWLEESAGHRDGDLGFFLRLAGGAGLGGVGRGVGRFLSFGSLDIPAGSPVPGRGGRLLASGFSDAEGVHPFDQELIAEHTAFSWYEGGAPGGLHPFSGETRPRASGNEGGRYSWAKAPRYRGQPAETGPLAEAVIDGDPLFADLIARRGPSALVRQLARMVRPARLVPVMDTWLAELMAEPDGCVYSPPPPIENGRGHGLIQAARGALGHWVSIEDGAISRYQVITPSAWNGSPRDDAGVRGPWEEALIGVPVADPENPVTIGHVIRSFDPCLVCTVHTLSRGRVLGRTRLTA